jgi:hypothetical protein
MTHPSQAQAPTEPRANPTTGVFALLTAKPSVKREEVMAVMPAEIRATVRLYLAGKIRAWYARGDGRGAIFLLDVKDLDEAHSMMGGLPLAQANLLDHEFIPVGPLVPLGLLVQGPSANE